MPNDISMVEMAEIEPSEINRLREENARLKSLVNSGENTLEMFRHRFGIFLLDSSIFRAGWLVSLLVFQSMSSVILQKFLPLIKHHPTVIFFLVLTRVLHFFV